MLLQTLSSRLVTLLATLPCLGIILIHSSGARAEGLSSLDRQRAIASPQIAAEVARAFDTGAEAHVMILFQVPEDSTRPAHERAERRRGQAQTFTSERTRRAMKQRRRAMVRRFKAGEFRLRHEYSSLNLLAGSITPEGLVRLLDDPQVERVDLDLGGEGGLVEAKALSNFTPVAQQNWTGNGIQVAIIDSGVDSSHDDLASAIIDEECFCSDFGGGCCPSGGTTESGPGAALDDHGHGTHVAGIVTSDGGSSPAGGAPQSEIVAIKVLDDNNSFCCTSDVVKALDYLVNDQPDIDIVNLSLGTFALYSGICDDANGTNMALSALVGTLRDRGVLTFAASMNNASASQMAAPACLQDVISVGAVYDADHGSESFGNCSDPTTAADQVTCFSNSNDETDLFAPGATTTSTRLGGGTTNFQGTSQASPLVAACAATLLEGYPVASAGDVIAALLSSNVSVIDAKNGLSFPRLDCGESHSFLAAIFSPPIVPMLQPTGLFLLGLTLVITAGRRLRN